FGLGAEVREVDIAFCVRRHDDDVHSAHGGGSGIGAVSGRWNETYVAMLLPATPVIRSDRSSPAYSPCAQDRLSDQWPRIPAQDPRGSACDSARRSALGSS